MFSVPDGRPICLAQVGVAAPLELLALPATLRCLLEATVSRLKPK
jgi:hypothetical protein